MEINYVFPHAIATVDMNALVDNKKIGVFPIDYSDWKDIGTNNEYINFLKNIDAK